MTAPDVPCDDCAHPRSEHVIHFPRSPDTASLGCERRECGCRSFVIMAKLKSTLGFNVLVKL